MQAMATGLPVVATTVGAIAEAVRHEHTGVLVPPRDAGALARRSSADARSGAAGQLGAACLDSICALRTSALNACFTRMEAVFCKVCAKDGKT